MPVLLSELAAFVGWPWLQVPTASSQFLARTGRKMMSLALGWQDEQICTIRIFLV